MIRHKQKKRTTQALLTRDDIKAIRAALSTPLETALFEWLYTNGARASEPGLAQTEHLDLRSKRVRLVHLKHGLAAQWLPLAPSCEASLKAWFGHRPVYEDARRTYVFPRAEIIDCYECSKTGKVERQFRTKTGTVKRTVACPLCAGFGRCPGLTRHDVRHIIVAVFKRAGISEDLRFPHVLRHSAVSHLLDRGMLPTAIQERVGHKSVETTYGYMHATKEAHDLVAKAFSDEDDE